MRNESAKKRNVDRAQRGELRILKMELILSERLKNEMRRIKQRIDNEKDRAKKAKMIKAYRKMSETLI
jgi:hypothetical protein